MLQKGTKFRFICHENVTKITSFILLNFETLCVCNVGKVVWWRKMSLVLVWANWSLADVKGRIWREYYVMLIYKYPCIMKEFDIQ